MLSFSFPFFFVVQEGAITEMSSHGLRCICLAFRDFDKYASVIGFFFEREGNFRILQVAKSAYHGMPCAYPLNPHPPFCCTGRDGGEAWEREAPESELVCQALVGIADPIREDVPSAVALCRSAGSASVCC